MNSQKDIKNTDLNSYGQSDPSSHKLLVNKDVYKYSYKKTEKLVTALYMVTDCMEVDDALKGKIRTLAIEILSYMHKLSHASQSPVDNSTSVSSSLTNIDEILSLIGIANNIGYISDMNTLILRKELSGLGSELKATQTKDSHFSFTLNEKMFDLPEPRGGVLDDTSIGQSSKRTQYNTSFRNDNHMSLIKRPISNGYNSMGKQERIDKILNIIKEKKGLIGNEAGVSIKDISVAFTDFSEKTIQRELNSLVSKGQIKKIGAKRWSRYQAI